MQDENSLFPSNDNPVHVIAILRQILSNALKSHLPISQYDYDRIKQFNKDIEKHGNDSHKKDYAALLHWAGLSSLEKDFCKKTGVQNYWPTTAPMPNAFICTEELPLILERRKSF